MEEFIDISDETLLRIWNTKEDYIIILKDGTFIPTDDEAEFEVCLYDENLLYVFYSSDFESMFEIKDELVKRGIII